MAQKIATAVLEIKTDVSSTTSGFDQVEKRGRGLAQTFKGLSKDTGGFGSALSATSKILGGFGIGLSVGAAVAFGKSLLDGADALVRMSDQTGLTIQTLQRFQAVADESGTSVEAISAAVFKLQDNLGSGSSSVQAGLKSIGLELEDIKNLTPENQFRLVARELGNIKNQTELVNAGTAIFGKSFKEILPAIKAGFGDAGAAAGEMSEDTVRAMDEAGDMIAKAGRVVKGFAAESLVGLVHFVADGATPTAYALGEIAREAERARIEMTKMIDAIPKAKIAMPAPLQVSDAVTNKDALDRAAKDIDDQIKKQIDDRKKAAEAAKKAAEEIKQALTEIAVLQREVWESGTKNITPFLDGLEQVGQQSDEIERLRDKFKELGDVIRNSLLKVGDITIRVRLGLDPDEAQNFTNLVSSTIGGQAGMIGQLVGGGTGVKIGHGLGDKIKDGLSASFQSLPALFMDAFTGGGGVMGAVKAAGVMLGDALTRPIFEKLKIAQKTALSMGAAGAGAVGSRMGGSTGATIATAASTIGGAALATTSLGTAAATSIGASIALGAATMGIGVAAVGAYYGLKKLFSLTAEYKQGRQMVDDYQAAFGSFEQMIETIGEAYRQVGKTSEMAQADVLALMEAEHQGGAAVQAVIDKINESLAAAERQRALLDEASSLYGPSQTDLEETEKHLHDIFDAMVTAGTFSASQLEKAYYAWQVALAAAGNEAAAAWVAAHDAVTEGAAAASSAIDALQKQRDELAKSYENEAEEAVMGSREQAARDAVAAIDAQIAAAKASSDAIADAAAQAAEATAATGAAATDASTDTTTAGGIISDCWADVGRDADTTATTTDRVFHDALGNVVRYFGDLGPEAEGQAGRIRAAFDGLNFTIPVRFDVSGYPTGPGGVTIPAPPMAAGGFGRVRRASLFVAGEAGAEDVVFGGAGRNLAADVAKALGQTGGGGSGVTVGSINVTMPAASGTNPRELAENFKHVLRTDATVYEAVSIVSRRAAGTV